MRRIAISRGVANRVSSTHCNIITERLAGEPSFDVAVATNVLLYFNDEELLLAMHNIRAMLKSGGYFIHNDLRGKVAAYGAALGLGVVHARMVRLERSPLRELHDPVIIHKK